MVAQVTDNYVLWFGRKLNQGGRGYGLCLVGEVRLLEHVDDFSFALDLAVHRDIVCAGSPWRPWMAANAW
ncbi:MAG TPA: hypothetical protein VKB96_18295 [Gammaproteobacteria bacterium]|nr:hypothetical protein [Gammaproteobacteria bacterium]